MSVDGNWLEDHQLIHYTLYDCSKKTLSIIESHTMTKYCTEAWLLLSLVANKMRSSNPDRVAAEFIKQVTEKMVNCEYVF